MRKLGKRLGYGAAAVVTALAVLAWSGGALNWNMEPPYELAQSWGAEGEEAGRFNSPTGIAVHGEEVFVADARNNRVQVFDRQGVFKRAFGEEELGRPMNLEIAGDRLYVPDYFKDVIHVFTLDGEYRQALGAEDGLESPGGVAVYADGSLLVADTYAQRIVHIAPDGTVLKRWGEKEAGLSAFSYPTDVAIAPDGGFYVADGYNDRIQQFGPGGELVRKWGGPFAMNIFGPFKGWFTTVTSVAVSADGFVFAADFYNDRIQKFTASGRYLTSFGEKAEGPGHSQIAVAVDDNGAVWSTHYAGHRVQQWRPR